MTVNGRKFNTLYELEDHIDKLRVAIVKAHGIDYTEMNTKVDEIKGLLILRSSYLYQINNKKNASQEKNKSEIS